MRILIVLMLSMFAGIACAEYRGYDYEFSDERKAELINQQREKEHKEMWDAYEERQRWKWKTDFDERERKNEEYNYKYGIR